MRRFPTTMQGFQVHVYVVVILHLTSCSANKSPSGYICCFPVQLEAFSYGISGEVDVYDQVDSNVGYGYGYNWAHVRSAYDSLNKRTYSYQETVSWTSFFPGFPIKLNETRIMDYRNNIYYTVDNNGSCTTSAIDEPLYQECIPGNATLIGEQRFGPGNQTVRHYMFYDRIYSDPYQITVSVVQSDTNSLECLPVRMTDSQAYIFSSNHNVDLAAVNIVDITPGIKDEAIFDPPPQCQRYPTEATSGIRKTWGEHYFPRHRRN